MNAIKYMVDDIALVSSNKPITAPAKKVATLGLKKKVESLKSMD